MAREKRKVEIFGNGKCKIIAIFSANDGDVTSVSLSLSLSLSLHAPHVQYCEHFHACIPQSVYDTHRKFYKR